MRQTTISLTVTMIFASLATQGIAENNCRLNTCQGDLELDHSLYEYKFTTNSRVYERDGWFVFETCVKNNGDKELDFSWLIPGPTTWVPIGCAVAQPRERSTSDRLDSFSGCLRYGNSWRTTRAEFVPHSTDHHHLDKEREADCDELIDEVQQGAELVKGIRQITTDVELFAPSSIDDVHDTMSRILVTTTITPNFDEKTFTHKLSFSINSVYNSDNYYFKGLMIQPPPKLLSSYKDQLGGFDFATIDNESSISATFVFPENAVLTSVPFSILSADGKPVASALVPMWVDGG